MALPEWDVYKTLGAEKCANERDSWQCPNMNHVGSDTDMNFERYKCEKCGRRVTLDYDDMR